MTLSRLPSTLFATPNAERETWLGDVFVRQPVFEQLINNESTVIYGALGAGKTALRLILQQSTPSNVLVVPWSPEPIADMTLGTPLAQAALHQAIQILVEQLIQNGQIPARLRQSPDWTGAAIAWFLREYIPIDAAFYIESQGAHLASDEIKWYLDLLRKPAVTIFKEGSTQNDQLRILMNLLQQADIQSVWWMVDGLEKWPPRSEESVRDLVESLLSTLAIFDLSRVVFKLFAPEALQEIFQKTSGLARDRLKSVRLVWDETSLIALLEQRLAVGFSQPDFALPRLCPVPDFYRWLRQYGGLNPRSWLMLVKPFVELFETTKKPLSQKDWSTIARQYPPALRLVPERQEVRLCEQSISIDSADGFKILHYLYQHAHKICSLEEVYFRGIKGMPNLPNIQDMGWEHKSLWRPAIDTTIYRLRKKLEWDSAEPIYLVTHPHRGLELTHVSD